MLRARVVTLRVCATLHPITLTGLQSRPGNSWKRCTCGISTAWYIQAKYVENFEKQMYFAESSNQKFKFQKICTFVQPSMNKNLSAYLCIITNENTWKHAQTIKHPHASAQTHSKKDEKWSQCRALTRHRQTTAQGPYAAYEAYWCAPPTFKKLC